MINERILSSFKEEEREIVIKNMGMAMGKAANYRGQILEHFVLLEINLELLISEYFTNCDPLKSQQLIYALFGQETFNFHNKRRLAIFVIENGLKGFTDRHKNLDTKLQNVNSFRNLIAHRKLDTRPEVLLNFNGSDINLLLTTTSDNQISLSSKTINQELIKIESKKIAELSEIILEAGELIRLQKK